MESKGVSRRQLLARGGKLAAAASAAPYLIAPGAVMAGEAQALPWRDQRRAAASLGSSAWIT